MKDRREFHAEHADCPVRYTARGLTMCGATDTPCEYCADREPVAPSESCRARSAGRNDRARASDRNRPSFEDS